MANSKQAEKRARQNEKRRMRNRAHRTRMRTAIKKLRLAVEQKDAAAAQSLLPQTCKVIDSTAQKQVIHRNTAARYKARLSKAVAALAS